MGRKPRSSGPPQPPGIDGAMPSAGSPKVAGRAQPPGIYGAMPLRGHSWFAGLALREYSVSTRGGGLGFGECLVAEG